MIGKNHKMVMEKLQAASTHSSYDGTPKIISFAQAKAAMEDMIKGNKIRINDDGLASVLEPAILTKQFVSDRPKLIPAFGEGYYEERPTLPARYDSCMYDIGKLIRICKERFERTQRI